MHRVRTDPINRLVELRLSGALDIAAVEAAGESARLAVRSLGGGPGAHVSLYDLTDADPPRADAVRSAFDQWNDPRLAAVRARKVAVVAPRPLVRLGLAKPGATRPNMAVFEDRQAAMRWLFT